MTTIENNNEYIQFDYISNIDNLEFGAWYNVIEIYDMSEKMYNCIDITNGEITLRFSNNVHTFPVMFKTDDFEHTISVIGQFQFILTKMIKELSSL